MRARAARPTLAGVDAEPRTAVVVVTIAAGELRGLVWSGADPPSAFAGRLGLLAALSALEAAAPESEPP
jgi:hypothetical protein